MRVLLVRVGAMGDVLHALPAVAALRRAVPEAELGWAIEPRWQPLLMDTRGGSPTVDLVHPVETRLWNRDPLSWRTVRSLATLRSNLRARRYDICIDLQGSIRSALIGRSAGAALFFGPAQPRERPARMLYDRRVETGAVHVVEQAAQVISAALGRSLLPTEVELPADPVAEGWFAASSLDARPAGFVLLAPQAGWGAKQWPAERFGELARELHRAGYGVLVNQVGGGDPLAAEVVRASRGSAVPVESDLAQLTALTRRAALVVAGDTGPLHLAAALRKPVVALFGPTDPARTGPFGTRARVLRHATSVTDHRRHPSTEGGLLQITTEAVFVAATELLAGESREERG